MAPCRANPERIAQAGQISEPSKHHHCFQRPAARGGSSMASQLSRLGRRGLPLLQQLERAAPGAVQQFSSAAETPAAGGEGRGAGRGSGSGARGPQHSGGRGGGGQRNEVRAPMAAAGLLGAAAACRRRPRCRCHRLLPHCSLACIASIQWAQPLACVASIGGYALPQLTSPPGRLLPCCRAATAAARGSQAPCLNCCRAGGGRGERAARAASAAPVAAAPAAAAARAAVTAAVRVAASAASTGTGRLSGRGPAPLTSQTSR